ncbi:MAG: cpp25 [Ignavibacteria bacterium]|nr:MAG: cpp25 [Ignavibacteria bacterium]KAF0161955.1 MAG: cpp25 [Ignavibacteria bacterium]
MTAKEAENLLLKTDFFLDRQKGNHKTYKRELERIVIPLHTGKDLHPKIGNEVKSAVEKSR